MIRRMLVPLLLITALAACASTQGLIVAPLDAGHERVYPDSFTAVVPLAREAVLQNGLKIDTILHPDSLTLMIVAKTDASWFSYGELVRLLARPRPDGETSVRVYTMPRLGTNVTYTRWDDEVFIQLGRGLVRRIQTDTAGRPRRWAPEVEIVRSLAPHAGVRIAAGSRHAGSAVNDGDSVLVLDGRQRIPVAAIDSLWLRKSYVKTGAVIGSLAGVVAGALIARANTSPCSGLYGECFASSYATVLVSAAGGTVVGALIGSVFPKWKFRYP